MEEMDKVLKDNLTKTRFAILVEKSREKLRRDGEKEINKIPVAAKPGKVINASNREKDIDQDNITLFTQATIKKYVDRDKGFEPGE